MAAIPRRGCHLTGEVFDRRALAFCVVYHAVFSNSIPNPIDERLGARFDFLAARIGKRDVARGFAGDGRGRLFVDVGDGFGPEVGGEIVIVEIKSAVLVADGGDETGAGRPVAAPYRAAVTLVCGVKS